MESFNWRNYCICGATYFRFCDCDSEKKAIKVKNDYINMMSENEDRHCSLYRKQQNIMI